MKALINKIIPFSFIDGPSSRMAVFFQGCNMNCLYCHNPETQNRCNHCGECVETCPTGALSKHGDTVRYNQGVCAGCDRCLACCPNFSSPKCIEMTLDTLFQRIRHNADFIDGITVSGGEATLQAGFILKLFQMIKESTGLTTFLDTNGLIDADLLAQLCGVTDGFMVDLKGLDPVRHLELTGTSNTQILKNIQQLGKTERLYEVRTVVVPGFTDEPAEIGEIAALVRDLNDYTRLKLIPFRPWGVKTRLGDEPSLNGEKFQVIFEVAKGILGNRAVT